MGQRSQVLYPFTNPSAIVYRERADAPIRHPGIHKNQRDISRNQLVQQRSLDAEGHDSDSFNIPLQKAANAFFHSSDVVVGGADHDVIAVFHRYVFESLDEFGK